MPAIFKTTNHRSGGFTIVEILVVLTVLGILIGLVLNTLGDFYYANTTSLGKTVQDTDTRYSLRAIESELSNTAGWSTSLPVASAPLGMNNSGTAWSYCGNDCATDGKRVLIAYVMATDKPKSDNTRLPTFTPSTSGSSCDPAQAGIIKNALIYFIAQDPSGNSNLYRRTIVNPFNLAICSGSSIDASQKTTCSPWQVSTYPAVCKGPDALLLPNVTSLSINYYGFSSNSTPVSTQYTSNPNAATDVAAAKTVELKVTTSANYQGVANTSTSAIRVSRLYP